MNSEFQRTGAAPARMLRIKKITGAIQWLINGTFILMLVFGGYFLLELAGFVPASPGVKITFSPNQTYTSPFIIPWSVLTLAFMRFGLFSAGVVVVNNLLSRCAEGQFFTNSNVRAIKRIGYVVIGDWVLTKVLDALARGLELSFGQLALGLLVILIAWIMDEGRKLQEEQALTV